MCACACACAYVCIYDRMDQDESGAMSFEEVNEGLKMYAITLGKTVSLSKDD